MTQTFSFWLGDREVRRELPDAQSPVLPGIRWGEPWNLFTPAYWVSQLWMAELDTKESSPYHAQGGLAQELTFCLLGGFGITAELATAAFRTCCDAGLVDELNASPADWAEVLGRQLVVGGRSMKYRYPNQKAIYLADAMRCVSEGSADMSDGRALRDSLLSIRGVGPKTAGWVARNLLDSDDVAILDIHIVRAGLLCDLFRPEQKVEREYFEMEASYIEMCRALKVRPAVLDCLIWDQMRTLGPVALDAVKYKSGAAPFAAERLPVQAQIAFAH